MYIIYTDGFEDGIELDMFCEIVGITEEEAHALKDATIIEL